MCVFISIRNHEHFAVYNLYLLFIITSISLCAKAKNKSGLILLLAISTLIFCKFLQHGQGEYSPLYCWYGSKFSLSQAENLMSVSWPLKQKLYHIFHPLYCFLLHLFLIYFSLRWKHHFVTLCSVSVFPTVLCAF